MRVKMILPALTEATSRSFGRSNTRSSRRWALQRLPPTWARTMTSRFVMNTSKSCGWTTSPISS